MRDKVSVQEARRIALRAQGLEPRPIMHTPTDAAPPQTRHLKAVLQKLGTTQIDSVNVFARCHYMPTFSRLGPYPMDLFDKMLFSSGGSYTEFWPHEAGFIATKDWHLFRFRMDENRRRMTREGRWAGENSSVIEAVRKELEQNGPSLPRDLGSAEQGARGPWWGWSDAKRALESLFAWGEVAIDGRQKFQRRYAAAEHVIPDEHLQQTIPEADAIRELTKRAVRAHGLGTVPDIADYYRLDKPRTQQALDELVETGEVTPVSVHEWGDTPVYADSRAAIPRKMTATSWNREAEGEILQGAILSPFDPLIWFRQRALRLFNMDYRIEIYTPAAQRKYGYYSLPVLIEQRLAARVDLKADRKNGKLLVQSAWWHEGEHLPGDSEKIAALLQEAAIWQGLEDIVVADWGDASTELRGALLS